MVEEHSGEKLLQLSFWPAQAIISKHLQLPTKTLIHEWKNNIPKPKLFVCILVYS